MKVSHIFSRLTVMPLLLGFASGSLMGAVKVAVSPARVIVKPGDAEKTFTATVTGDSNTDVTWKWDSSLGTLDPDGSYTPPSADDFKSCYDQDVTITATSVADPKATATATVVIKGTLMDRYDCREDFDASFYLGLAVDTFAADEQRSYLNPDAANGKHERGVGGFDIDYRLYGDPKQSKATGKNAFFKNSQLWVYAETIHGVRSADVPCSSTTANDFFLCQQGKLNFKSFYGKDPVGDLLLIIRNASSLEGFMGFRYEFATLNRTGDNPANVYFKAQAGFLKVSGAPGGALDMHHIGLGAISTKGIFQGSYLEGGWGRSDVFTTQRRHRKKVDGFLTWHLFGPVNAFAQIVVDTDLGYASDSIQSYFGLQFDIRRFNFKF